MIETMDETGEIGKREKIIKRLEEAGASVPETLEEAAKLSETMHLERERTGLDPIVPEGPQFYQPWRPRYTLGDFFRTWWRGFTDPAARRRLSTMADREERSRTGHIDVLGGFRTPRSLDDIRDGVESFTDAGVEVGPGLWGLIKHIGSSIVKGSK